MEFDMKEALARRRKEETMLRFTKFSHEDALTLGLTIVKKEGAQCSSSD